MGDLISRSALIKELEKDKNAVYSHVFAYVDSQYDAARLFMDLEVMINNQPTVEAEPVVHGEWIIKDKGLETNINTWRTTRSFSYKCSLCGYRTGNQGKYFNYCPNCGAKMDGGVKNECCDV